MNNGRSIYDTDFAKYLPEALKEDDKITGIAKALSEQLIKASGICDNALIYARIDELPEEVLDVLAYDFHCDWYDKAYPIETKRRILKNNVTIHKKLGTKYAVEKALADVYKTAKVQEWFEYGGEPYHFKISVDIGNTGITQSTKKEIEDKMKFYKNLRSHCDGIHYELGTGKKADAKAVSVLRYAGKIRIRTLQGS